MPRISLTDFVDFVSKVGTPKITKVREIKARPEYHPARDHYKYLRDGIKTFHEEGHANKNTFFNNLLTNLPDEKKRERFTLLATGYKGFLGTKVITNEERDNVIWTHGNLEVNVNPELCLNINGRKHLIKLYFKADDLTKLRIDVILYLMQNALHAIPNVDNYSILFIEKRRLLTETDPDPALQFLLQAEAEGFLTIYNALP
jgi:hypothetical protein